LHQEIQKFNDYPYLLFRGGYDLLEKNLMEKKMKRRQEEAMFTKDSTMIIDLPSPIARHAKWKMAHTKLYMQMRSKATQEISDKIVSSC